jgi:hypothetical protein
MAESTFRPPICIWFANAQTIDSTQLMLEEIWLKTTALVVFGHL